MSNVLIVESENDKFFFEALITHINVKNITVDSPVCTIDDYDCLGGISKLKKKLKALRSQALKEGIDKVGIIFDADDVGIEKRTQQIQEKIQLVFKKESEIYFSIFILNKEGKGELETLLKAIKSEDSTVADCLDDWQNCLPVKKKLTQKQFDKLWIQTYQRYDCCNKKEQKQAGRKCSNEASLKDKNIYDFDRDIEELQALKNFLMDFSSATQQGADAA